MNAADQIPQIIRIVSNGLQKKRPEAEITAELIKLGVSKVEAPRTFATVRDQMRAGVQAAVVGLDIAVTGGRSGDPLAEAAFLEGYQAFRKVTRGVKLERIAFLVVGLVIVVVVLTRLFGLWGNGE